MNKNSVYSVTENIPIAAFRKQSDAYMNTCFTPEEIAELYDRPLQTKAGILAVKKALIKMYSLLFHAHDTEEKSFVILHKENGAPYIKSLPEIQSQSSGYSLENIHISISHNREHAYGLAALREKRHG